jgi:hypothetical protein
MRRAPVLRCARAQHTFFMMPALRLLKVMCRRDLSVMNLISIFRRSRPGLSSSSSSSSAAGRPERVANIQGAAAVVVQLRRRVLVVVGDFGGHGGG